MFWTARQSWIDKNRAALVDFMEDMLRIERWYLDPKNHDEAAKIAGKLLKLPPERFGWLFTKKDYYRDPNMMPDLVALQRNVDTHAEMGFFKSSFDVKKHSDLSLIEEAAKRLKVRRSSHAGACVVGATPGSGSDDLTCGRAAARRAYFVRKEML